MQYKLNLDLKEELWKGQTTCWPADRCYSSDHMTANAKAPGL